MTVLFLTLIIPFIYIIGKDLIKETKEIFFEEEKPKKKSKCKIYLFPVWKTKNYRSAENAEF